MREQERINENNKERRERVEREQKKMKRVQTMMIMGRSRIKLKDAGIRQGKEEG